MLRAQRGGNALLTSRPVRLSDGRPAGVVIPPPPPDDGTHGGHGTTGAAEAGTPDATTGQTGAAVPGATDSHGGHPAA